MAPCCSRLWLLSSCNFPESTCSSGDDAPALGVYESANEKRGLVLANESALTLYAPHASEAIPLHSKGFTAFMNNPDILAYLKREVAKRLKRGCTHVRNDKGNCLVECGKEFSRNLRPNWKPYALPEATALRKDGFIRGALGTI